MSRLTKSERRNTWMISAIVVVTMATIIIISYGTTAKVSQESVDTMEQQIKQAEEEISQISDTTIITDKGTKAAKDINPFEDKLQQKK